MSYPFPSEDWLNALQDVLNSDERYAQVASNWEGDLLVVIEPDDGPTPGLPMTFYLDLWHGRCREVRVIRQEDEVPDATFSMSAKLRSILRIFQGELDPMQAMLTRRLHVQGNMAYMLRNVPTVLDFVRCCRKVDIDSE